MEHHKISIENLGPLEKIEKFEVKKINILIGESASGKSILAKAVYFFNSIFLEEFEYQYFESGRGEKKHIENLLEHENLLEQLFPYNQYKLKYYYTDKLSVEVTRDKKYTIKYSGDLEKEIKKLEEVKQIRDDEKIKRLEEKFLKTVKEEKVGDIKQVISELEKYDLEGIYTFIAINDFHKKMGIISTIFIPATRSFVSDFDDIRLNELNRPYRFRRNIRNDGIGDITLRMFSDLYRRSLRDFKKNDKKYNELLKGDLYSDNLTRNLQLKVDNQTELSINQISSGQKEIVPLIIILQTLEEQKNPHLLIVEEPESHLFPSDQRKVFDLLIEFTNATNSKLMITTHSPYMLMSADNLIKAKAKNYELFKAKYIDFNEINASKLENNKVESVLNQKYKMVSTKYMEKVTDSIMEEYDKIVESNE